MKAQLDITAFVCPMTWVKTRIALGRLAEGDTLEVRLREGEPLGNVPRSAREEGHRVVSTAALGDGIWLVVLEKRQAKEENPWP